MIRQRASAINGCDSHPTGSFLALEIRGREVARGLRLAQSLGNAFDLRQPLARLDILKVCQRAAQLLLGLPPCGDLVLALEHEQCCTRSDLITTLHQDLIAGYRQTAGRRTRIRLR